MKFLFLVFKKECQISKCADIVCHMHTYFSAFIPKFKSDDNYLRIKSLFFKLHNLMKTVGGAKIPRSAMRLMWNFSDDHCLHHIMKVEK